ncbi:ComEA family DNA-binding protein [Actinomadura kijaniata]|uniref:ComEA family DNA-binding protein n=1 Tax=Actinomadura kijaniata TaxID=46161 RepID=UPI000A01A1BF|nr:ComEA family DNA-binding protein [Actinomadura kijaniata]
MTPTDKQPLFPPPVPQAPPAARLRSGPTGPDHAEPPSRRQRIPAAEDAAPKRRLRLPMTEDLDPGVGGARVLVIVGVIAVLAAGGYLWLARPTPEPVPAPATAFPTPATALPAPAAALPPAGAPSSPTAEIVVHVFGKVKTPGIVTLPAGSRVSDAIEAAGGVRPGTGTGALNLARKVQDGEQIAVGVPPPDPRAAGSAPAAPTEGGPGTTPPNGGGPLDLNAATAAQLDALPGVGPVLAQRIVDYRTQNGGFRSVDQLQEVTGIGAKRFTELKAMVRV